MGLFDAIASSAANLTDNVVGMVNQNHQNKVNLRMMREQNAFNAEQAQIQRDWQQQMWGMNNAYNSPSSMISRGLNPFIQGSAAMAGSKSPASGGAAATAAPVPSMQAYKPNFSSVFQSLASLAQAKASEASAGESGSRARQTDTVTPLLSDYYRGLTNWKNLAIGSSGYWNKETGTGLSVMRWCVPVPVTTTWPILVKLSCSLIRRFFSPPFVVIDLGV